MTRTPAQRALEQLLPPKNGRRSEDRLRAIAGKALADAQRGVRLRGPVGPASLIDELTEHQAEEALGHLLEAGLKAALEYDPAKDTGANSKPLDVRFSAFAYYRMRQRFIDWYRRNIHDSRPGRSDRRTVSLDERTDNQNEASPDFTDLVASDDRIQRWTSAAQLLGFDLNSWILSTLDDKANDVIDHQAA